MREILFRGKRDGKWLEGSLLRYPDGDRSICIGSDEPDALTQFHVKPETVGQFTGQLAQGVRVFEGDIFRYGDEVYVVKWDSGGAKFFCYCLDGSGWICDFLEIHWDAAEIIGNIHDNPELLEVD